MKRKRQDINDRMRCTVADVLKALELQRTDPERFSRSPRLRWILATCKKLVEESKTQSRWVQ